jgi:hypothetical protein
MKKRNYAILALVIIIIGVASLSASIFIFQGDEQDICGQCKMLNCHKHATSDNYCCNMCDMGESSKCDCEMPTSSNKTLDMNETNNMRMNR